MENCEKGNFKGFYFNPFPALISFFFFRLWTAQGSIEALKVIERRKRNLEDYCFYVLVLCPPSVLFVLFSLRSAPNRAIFGSVVKCLWALFYLTPLWFTGKNGPTHERNVGGLHFLFFFRLKREENVISPAL